MAKIVNGSLVLDPDDRIEFIDEYDIPHYIYWDELLDRFLVSDTLEAAQFVRAVNSVTADRPPQPNDDTYEVPTIWVNTLNNLAYVLVMQAPGNSVWQLIADGDQQLVKNRITINTGEYPEEVDPFDMWITIEPD
jgi:hypothetical protein